MSHSAANSYWFFSSFTTGLSSQIPVIELILGPGQRVNHEVYRCHGVTQKPPPCLSKNDESVLLSISLCVGLLQLTCNGEKPRLRSQVHRRHAAILTPASFFSVCWSAHMEALPWLVRSTNRKLGKVEAIGPHEEGMTTVIEDLIGFWTRVFVSDLSCFPDCEHLQHFHLNYCTVKTYTGCVLAHH